MYTQIDNQKGPSKETRISGNKFFDKRQVEDQVGGGAAAEAVHEGVEADWQVSSFWILERRRSQKRGWMCDQKW